MEGVLGDEWLTDFIARNPLALLPVACIVKISGVE